MLVLTRGDGESVQIDDARVTVQVQRSGPYGVRVRLLIDAPPDVPIERTELGPLASSRIRCWANRAKGVRP